MIAVEQLETSCNPLANHFKLESENACALILKNNHFEKLAITHSKKNHYIFLENSQNILVEFFVNKNSSDIIEFHSEIILKDKAKLQHLQIILKNSKTNITNDTKNTNANLKLHTSVTQNSNSSYQCGFFPLDFENYQAHFNINLNGENAKAKFQALMMHSKQQKAYLSLLMNHLKSNCESNIVTRGVINNEAKAEFIGKILIGKNASYTKALLENKNLLLSEQAEMITKPVLEVYNEEILKCTHGATIGYLDPNALFYLKSRGIPETTAKQMLIDGFIKPTLENYPAWFLTYIEEKIHGN